MNINFEIVEINTARGVALVKYWADGATFERFEAEIGPYEILMLPQCECMSDEEFKNHIATWGEEIVRRQQDAILAEQQGVVEKYQSLLGKQNVVQRIYNVEPSEDTIIEDETNTETTTDVEAINNDPEPE